MTLAQYFEEPTTEVIDTSEDEFIFKEHLEIESGFATLEALENMDSNLSVISNIAKQIDILTERDVMWVQSLVNSTIKPTGLSTEDIKGFNSSLESLSGATVSTESLGQIIKDIWKAIVRTLDSLWKAFTGLFKKTQGKVNKLKEDNDKIISEFEQYASNKVSVKDVTMGKEILHLVVDNKYPKNGGDVVKSFENYESVLKIVLEDYFKNLEAGGKAIERGISSFNVQQPEESLQKLVDGVSIFNFGKLESKIRTNQPIRSGKEGGVAGSYYAGDNLLGDKALIMFRSSISNDVEALMVKSEALRGQKVIFDKVDKDKNTLPGQGSIDTITFDEAKKLHLSITNITKLIDGFDKTQTDITKLSTSIKKATDTFQSRSTSMKEESKNMLEYVKEALRYNTAFSRWYKDPHEAMVRQIVESIRAAQTYVKRSMENYYQNEKGKLDE